MNKRKINAIMLSIMTALCVTACNNSGNVSPEPDILPEPEEIIEQDSETNENYDENLSENTDEKATEGFVADGLYGDFLFTDGLLYFDEEKTVNINSIFSPEMLYKEYCPDYSKGYTLKETVKMVLAAAWNDPEIEAETYYWMIDAGADGVPEMCVSITADSPVLNSVMFVTKEIDGKLQCLCFLTSGVRFSYNLSYYGFITETGAGGAGDHSYTERYIDADGTCKFLFKEEDLYPGFSSCKSDAFEEISVKLTELEDNKGYTVVTDVASFEDEYRTDNFITKISIYDAEGQEITEAAPIYEEAKQIFANEGISVISSDEYNSVLEKIHETEGITDETMNFFDKIESQYVDYNVKG